MASTAALPDLDSTADRLRATFAGGRTRDLAWRERQLDGLLRLIEEREAELLDALAADLGRPPFEGWLADLRSTGREVEHLRKHLRRWAADEKVRPPWQLALARTRIIREPLGAVLVIAPWNYPFYLSVLPLATALAAGNTVCLKPSEVAPKVSAAMAELLPQFVDPEAVVVVEGAVEETTALLAQRWDHIFYTGNGAVGRVVARAAAEHLTPVTLELGGKSPTIVAADANLDIAAKRIAWGKFLNAGQTCVAPDYVLADRSIHDELVAKLADHTRAQRGEQPRASDSFGRIVNDRHARRLQAMLDAGGYRTVACGGEVDVEARYLAPTVLGGVDRDAAVMGDEIFGPILPVVPVDSIDDAIAVVNAGDKPLALYVFSSSDATVEKVLRGTSSGGACINDVMTHLLIPGLPFGGVGPSGHGAYHGKFGFETFSHSKSVLERPTWFEMPILYPPYAGWKAKLAKKLF
jgi:aldehyde dehydrogenase (NAD+)